MKANFIFVPPGGGEADHSRDFDMPAAPRVGEHIMIKTARGDGSSDYIVRQVSWILNYSGNEDATSLAAPPIGSTESVVVECEFARSPLSNQEHLSNCDVFEKRGLKVQDLNPPG